MTRQTLYDLGRHYNQDVETERLTAAGITPNVQWGEPHLKWYGLGPTGAVKQNTPKEHAKQTNDNPPIQYT